MKRLLEQQKDICKLWLETDGATLKDYRKAINQHIETLSKNNILRPMPTMREFSCKNGCKLDDNIFFKTIDGSFCKKCGFVYPF